jgi:BrnA antitoxin of type II toxin-antitoxin system
MRAEYDFSKGQRGALMPAPGKTRISIYIDNVVLDAFRARAEAAGTGYQTLMNEILRQHVLDGERPLTELRFRELLEEALSRPRKRVGSKREERQSPAQLKAAP